MLNEVMVESLANVGRYRSVIRVKKDGKTFNLQPVTWLCSGSHQ